MQAVAKYIRISPFKAMGVCDLVRGKRVSEAMDILNHVPRRAAIYVSKAIKSAVANALKNGSVDITNLYVSHISIDQGPVLKRWRARSRGRAGRVTRKTSHITVELKEK